MFSSFNFIKLNLILSFIVFSMLLNSMSVIILQFSQNNIQSYTGLGSLEFFKDIPNALVSIFLVEYIKKYSFNKALAISLILTAICSFSLPFLNAFWFLKIWFILIGISFSVAKICVFSIIKQITTDEKDFSRLMSQTEASFMLGIFLVNIEFALILNSDYKDFWKFGFWLVGLISIIASINMMKAKLNEENPRTEDVSYALSKSWKFFFKRNFLLFFVIIFFIVFTEQIFNSWLPTFYKNELKTNSFFALQSSAFLALFSFVGRIIASKVVTKFEILKYYFFCITFSVFLIFLSYIIGYENKLTTNILLFLFPLIGIFISPLYPLINSKFLATYSNNMVSKIVSFIILFTSLGGSIGSLSTSLIFEKKLGSYYFLFASFPLILILIFSLLLFYKKLLSKFKNNEA